MTADQYLRELRDATVNALEAGHSAHDVRVAFSAALREWWRAGREAQHTGGWS